MSSSTDAVGVEVRVPRETINDDVVIIAAWRQGDGALVRRGECIVDIETSKAVLEVEAEADGYLQILQPQGAEVPIGELIGRLLVEPPGAAAPAPREPAARTANLDDAHPEIAISKKAQRLIDEYGLDPAIFAGRGLIRESDVIRHLELRVAAGDAGRAAGPAPASETHGEPVEPIVPAATPARPPDLASGREALRSRGLFSDARASARDRGRGMIWLVWNYFWRNWLLGNLVKVAPRGVIDVLHRWRGVKMGRDCFIDPSATLETAYPENITLGNDVRVTVGAIIMTHIKAPNYLRETGIMPVVIKPVRLEDHCFIGVGAVVMPGVTVGKASVVTSGSVVVWDVPPYTMVGGNPARVIKRFPRADGEA